MRTSFQTLRISARSLLVILMILAPALAVSATLSSEDAATTPEKHAGFAYVQPVSHGTPTDSVRVIGIEEGEASYYGADFAGRHTASGEIFDPDKLTAAHPSLPMGTELRVTNLRNDRVVTVRINDRGPFVGDRVIDLSKRAAQEIGMIRYGHAPVQIEVIELP